MMLVPTRASKLPLRGFSALSVIAAEGHRLSTAVRSSAAFLPNTPQDLHASIVSVPEAGEAIGAATCTEGTGNVRLGISLRSLCVGV